ncbi:MAG TPA: efflux RND transporter periplasmic adaptor subunit [Terriglobia bacterium]|nr:efflux RND transporter periplasmic adaptor subunit [Terriglobia bacterium]
MEFLAAIMARRRNARLPAAQAWCAGALLASLLMLGGCAPKAAKSEGMQMEFRVPVTVAKATVKSVPVQVEAIGNVEAYSNVSVRTQIAGEIERAYFTQGEDVKKGQLLFTLDRRPFQTMLNQLEANLAHDQAQLANARAQAERNEKLFQAGIISKDQYDTFRTTAQAQEATVRAGRAAIENAKVNLSYCSIYSPLDGRTGAYQVYPGNIAKLNDTVLVVINQVHPIYVTFSVPEQYLGEVREYQVRGALTVQAQVPSDQRPPGLGQLAFIDNAVDTATGTIKMRATFPNSDDRLWPGQFVNVVMRLTVQSNATLVPSQAVQTGQMGKYVFVVKPDSTADLRPVAAGETVQGETVIEKGVVPGDTVVIDGQLLLAPGSKVEIKKGSGQ